MPQPHRNKVRVSCSRLLRHKRHSLEHWLTSSVSQPLSQQSAALSSWSKQYPSSHPALHLPLIHGSSIRSWLSLLRIWEFCLSAGILLGRCWRFIWAWFGWLVSVGSCVSGRGWRGMMGLVDSRGFMQVGKWIAGFTPTSKKLIQHKTYYSHRPHAGAFERSGALSPCLASTICILSIPLLKRV
jgi:hypothetical protein